MDARRPGPVLALAAATALLACGASGSTAPARAGTPPPAGGGTTPPPSGGGTTPLPTGDACLGAGLLASLGKAHLLVGLAGDDAAADAAPYDLRYQYIAGPLADGAAPCVRCDAACTSQGASCANAAGGCGWWGCWQWDQDPPGAFARGFVASAAAAAKGAQIPMLTYYVLLQASGVIEGDAEVTKASDRAFMARYLADLRFLAAQIGTAQAFVHLEPDFWGYAAQRSASKGVDCSGIPAAVASADPADCAGLPDTLAGLGRCMIRIVRTHAPNAKVGLHASGWGTSFDVLGNSDPALDPAAHAQRLAAFLVGCGARDGDFLAADMSDRDAGYYQSIGRGTWWDATNATLPSFHQAFAWSKALAEAAGLPVLWWQTPVGNMSQANTTDHWRDDRLDYAFAHMDELAASHAIGIAFGAGAAGQTTPSTDGGNLARRAAAYAGAGGQPLCGP